MAKRRKSNRFMKRAFGKHPGRLHRRLHVPEGERIPESKLEAAAHSSDPSLRKEAALARVGKRYGPKGGRHAAHRPDRARRRSARKGAQTRMRHRGRRRY